MITSHNVKTMVSVNSNRVLMRKNKNKQFGKFFKKKDWLHSSLLRLAVWLKYVLRTTWCHFCFHPLTGQDSFNCTFHQSFIKKVKIQEGGTLAVVFWAAWGTVMGASSWEVRTSPRLPIVKTVALFFSVALWKSPPPREAVSSIPIRSSLLAASSYWKNETKNSENPEFIILDSHWQEKILLNSPQ